MLINFCLCISVNGFLLWIFQRYRFLFIDSAYGFLFMVICLYKSRLRGDDSYILASQTEQVYYTSYPSMAKDLKDRWAVVKTKPRGVYEVAETVDVDENMEGEQFFQINERVTHTPAILNNDLDSVQLVTGEVIMVDAPAAADVNEDSEEAEFEDTDRDSDDENELVLSDHSSDE